jgi:perosamine synthetase
MSFIDKFIIQCPTQFKNILKKLNFNKEGIVFITNQKNELVGSITDGDIRRYILKNSKVGLINLKSKLINKKVKHLKYNSDIKKILKFFEDSKTFIKCLPLLNNQKKIIDICFRNRLNSIPLAEPTIDKKEIENVMSCLTTGWISSSGAYVRKFENSFEKYLGGGYAVSVTNGTAAIELALSSLGIKEKDEVIVPDFGFAAGINAVLSIGANPVIANIDTENWLICLKDLKLKITKKTKAILLIYNYGIVDYIEQIKKIAKEKNIFLIEDCAEALGATYKKKKVGLFGDCSTHSFYPNKTITTGEGGMVVFKSKNHYKNALILRNQGRDPSDKDFIHLTRGFNFRMNNIQASIGCAQLNKLNNFLKLRKKIFSYYDKIFLKDENISILPSPKNSTNSFWLYTVSLKNINFNKRKKLIDNLKLKGVEIRPAFSPLSTMKPYRKFYRGDNEKLKKLSYSSISLPTSPFLSKEKIEYICESLKLQIKLINSNY